MHYVVLKGLIITSHLLYVTQGIGIDGKLDFGGSSSSIVSDNKNAFTPFKYSKTIKTTNKGFENTGVVCIPNGCNATQITTTDTNGNTIETNVLVHVHTKIDFNENKTQSGEETPDIPIVVGYGGSQLDTTVDDDKNPSVGSTIFVPDSQNPTYTSTYSSSNSGSVFNPNNLLRTSTGTRISSINTQLENFNPSSRTNTFKPSISSINTQLDSLNPSSRLDTFFVASGDSQPIVSRTDGFGGSLDNANPSFQRDSGFYITKSPVASRVDYISKSFEKLDPAAKVGFYPSIDDTFKYKENGIEIKIPYFDPSYHNHYYGENPPPQYVWHSKKTNGFNPVEFKTVKSTWTPSLWNRRVMPHRHNTPIGQGVTCTCKQEDNGADMGLRWYPGAARNVPSITDPGSQINDKLAPLN